MRKPFTILLLLLSFFAISSCKKDKTNPEDNFCTLVESQNYEGTGPLVDAFLAGLDNTTQDEQLNQLKNWMAAKSCVDSVGIMCISCIETLPPQSELRVVFISAGRDTSLTMDILMSEPLKFRTFHE